MHGASLALRAAVAVPCFCCAGHRPLAKSRPLPLLRFGCLVRWTRLSFAVPHAWEAGLIGYVQTLSVTERASLAAFYFLRDPLANIIKVRVYLCICKAQNF